MPAFHRFLQWLCLPTGLLLLCGCQKPDLLPEAGYDYHCTPSGILCGYPIRKETEEPLFLAEGDPFLSYRYHTESDTFSPAETAVLDCTVGGRSVSLPYVRTESGPLYFQYEEDDLTVWEGAFGDAAVVTCGTSLYTVSASGTDCLSEHCDMLFDVHAGKDGFLWYDGESHTLYDTSGDGQRALFETATCTDAWYVRGADCRTVLFSDGSSWFYTEDGSAPVPCVLPETADGERTVFAEQTAMLLYGTPDTIHLCDVRSGQILPIDMGGLYRFSPAGEASALLPLSPDGSCLFFSDIDFLYRLNLSSGQLDLTYNEALIFEGRCEVSSMTPVSGLRVLLSQGSNEYTEFVPVLTTAVFEEDLPPVYEEEKFDLAPDTEP